MIADMANNTSVWTVYGPLGVVVGVLLPAFMWLMRHLITKVIPETQTAFTKSLTNQQKTFTDALREVTDAFKKTGVEDRSLNERYHADLVNKIEKCHESLMQAIKETRHAVKGLDNAIASFTARNTKDEIK